MSRSWLKLWAWFSTGTIATSREAPMLQRATPSATETGGGAEQAGDRPPQTTDARSRKLIVTGGAEARGRISGCAAQMELIGLAPEGRDGDQRGRSLGRNRFGIGGSSLARPLDQQQLRATRL